MATTLMRSCVAYAFSVDAILSGLDGGCWCRFSQFVSTRQMNANECDLQEEEEEEEDG